MDLILVYLFSYPGFDLGKNVVIFKVGNSYSMHIHNKKKYVLILGEGPTQRLDGTTKIADAKYSKNLSRLQRKVFA